MIERTQKMCQTILADVLFPEPRDREWKEHDCILGSILMDLADAI